MTKARKRRRLRGKKLLVVGGIAIASLMGCDEAPEEETTGESPQQAYPVGNLVAPEPPPPPAEDAPEDPSSENVDPELPPDEDPPPPDEINGVRPPPPPRPDVGTRPPANPMGPPNVRPGPPRGTGSEINDPWGSSPAVDEEEEELQ